MRSETPAEAPLHCWHMKSARVVGNTKTCETVSTCCWCAGDRTELTKPTKRRKAGHGTKVTWGMTETDVLECDREADELCPGRVVVVEKQGSLLPGGAS